MKTHTINALKAGAAPLVLGIALISTPAFAQDAADEAEPTIIVTGSRIASPVATSVSPVQVINDTTIDETGATNLQEILLENPAFGTPALSRTNSAFLTSGTGVATVDLRDLGSDRTLVLINGRRVVAGLPGTSTVDLNVIPTQFISRVDVLTGGASSLYGSDAVAGVVNIMYKTDFEGIEANAQYNVTSRGDNADYQANLTFGSNFADDRGNMMLHIGYTNQGGLASAKRKNTQIDDLDTFWNISGDPADYGVSAAPFYSSYVPQGRFDVYGTGSSGDDFTYGPTGLLQPCYNSNAATCGGGAGIGPNGFNRQAFRTIAVPVERMLFAARGNYEISDSINFFAEGTYSNTSSSREIEPFPLDSAGANGIYPVGRAPIETYVPVTGAPGTFTIVRNPFVPDAIYNAATDRDGDGLRDIAFARRLSEFGTRNGSTNRDFYRFVVGLEGSFIGDFTWDASYNFGRTTETQKSNGQVNVLNFRNALAAIPGVNGPVCADANARAQGCVPINIYGFNSISPAAVRYIAAEQTFQTRITQQVLQGNLTGSLFELPAGPLGVAVGVEYRRESSSEDNDALTNAGLNAGNALPDTAGSFNVKEVYGEVNVPILADTPGFHSLALRGAGRVSDYSTVGTVYTYSGGVEWSPFEDLRISGTYARSVRAPNVAELYTGPSQTFPSGLQDPCVGVTATSTGTTSTICRASPGVNANIAANTGVGINPATGANYTNAFTLTQPDIQGISGFNSGNPNLNEEKSTSWTASATLTPKSIDFLRNAMLRVDYYNIDVKDSIINPPRTFILQQCYVQGDPTYCDFIVRRPTVTGSNSAGSIDLINSAGVNGGALKVEGIDVTFSNSVPLDGLGLGGRLNMRAAYTHILQGYLIPLPGAPKDVFAGEIGTAKDRFTAHLGYASDRLKVGFTGTYIGKSCEDEQSLAPYDVAPCGITVPSEFYLDSQISWNVNKEFEFYLGVDNLLDNDAPNILSGSVFNITGTDTAADVYDVFGRRFYAGVRLNF